MSDVRYLDGVAASDAGRGYKRQVLTALDLRPGHLVLDVGCGPGTDLPSLAVAVRAGGSVLGVDNDPGMLAEARSRTADFGRVEVREGDAHELPVGDGTVDRAKVDRVLQHLADPAQAVRELRRVLRTGGRAVLAEPDWYTLAIDDVDVPTSVAYTGFVVSRVGNPAIGRQLARLATSAGFAVPEVRAVTVVWRDFDPAEQILGLRRMVTRAIEAGAVERDRIERWLDRLATGPFLASATMFVAVGVVTGPPDSG